MRISPQAFLFPFLPVLSLFTGAQAQQEVKSVKTLGAVTVHAEEQRFLDFIPVATPVDLTPNGRIALLMDLGSPMGDVYLYDTRSRGLQLVTQVGSPLRDFVTAISATNRISALHDDPVQAALWTAAGGWLDFGSPFPVGCDQDIGGAWDVSADGLVATAGLWNGCTLQAFRWSDATGVGVFTPLEVLGSPPAGSALPNNRPTVLSDDARFAAGFAQTEIVDRWPAVWDANGDGFLLDAGGIFTDDSPGEVLSISADGSVVAGIWNQDGFYWSSATGVVNIGRLPNFLPFEPTHPNAIAADGRLIFGGCGGGFFGIPAAFVWTEEQGMRALQEIVIRNGLSIPDGFRLTNVLAASANGEILLGEAFGPNFQVVSFVLRLPTGAYVH